MEVNYTWWGREEYYLNGALLERRWNASLAGKRQFQIGGHVVRIEVFIGQTKYFTRVFVNDTVHVEELFQAAKAQFERWKRLPYRLVLVMAGVIAVLIALSLGGMLLR